MTTRNPYTIEVVASTVHSCVQAELGGAGRIELCSALGAAGITPSSGLLEVVKKHVAIPIYVMIRPREGDFIYDSGEIEVMKREIDLLGASGADGFVFGCLHAEGTVNLQLTRQLVAHCSGTPVTFHRAIDCTPDILQAVEEIASCGCERILTSGGKTSVTEGIETVAAMHEAARGRIRIMPGGGIKPEYFELIYRPFLSEYHLSGRVALPTLSSSVLFDMSRVETSREAIESVAYRPHS